MNTFVFQGRGVGKRVAFLVGLWNAFILRHLSATQPFGDRANWNGEAGATAASSLLGNVTAGAGVTELLSLDNETAHTWWDWLIPGGGLAVPGHCSQCLVYLPEGPDQTLRKK